MYKIKTYLQCLLLLPYHLWQNKGHYHYFDYFDCFDYGLNQKSLQE